MSVFLSQWKEEMMRRLKLYYKDYDLKEKKLDKYLDEIFHQFIKNPEIEIINNYRNKSVKTDLLNLIDIIDKNKLIIGGGGVLFTQHKEDHSDNILYGYIKDKQIARGVQKKLRKQYPDDSDEWARYNIAQNTIKLVINILYGVHGYEGFILYNRFIAESITNIGRQIITTAVLTFENFLNGEVKYNTEDELLQHITNINSEDLSMVQLSIFDDTDLSTIADKAYDFLIGKCAFETTDRFERVVKEMVYNSPKEAQILLYYKTNLYEFVKLPFITNMLNNIFHNVGVLMAPEEWRIENDAVKESVKVMNKLFEVYVFYNYPIYDRVRKAMYTDRKNVLYVDTDSNFLGLSKWVNFCKQHILKNNLPLSQKDMEFTIVNLMGLFLAPVIKAGLMTLGKYMNTRPEIADRLDMKNEFYMPRIVFTDAKKRYISILMLQEGQLLNSGNGKIDIKGFDFKKANTKQYLKKVYTDLCENDILRADKINVMEIYKKVNNIRKDIVESMMKGDSTFLKQFTVNLPEHYVNPYSTQGVIAVLVWNALCPEYRMEFPAECDIIPVLNISGPKVCADRTSWVNKKIVDDFHIKYPDAYERLRKEIYMNDNKEIREMNITAIARPKNSDIPTPDFIKYIIDIDGVVANSINLITPILKSLGLSTIKTNAQTEHITNIIKL